MEPQFIDKRFKAIEQRQSDTERTLDNHTELLRELDQKSDLHTQAFQHIETILNGHTESINVLLTDVETIKGDVSTLKTDMGTLKQRVTVLETKVDNGFLAMEKRLDAIAEVQRLILERLPERKDDYGR